MMNQNAKKPLLMLMTSMFIFGTIGIFRKQIPFSSGMLAFSRGVIGTVFLLLLTKVRRRHFNPNGAKTVLWLAASGVAMGFNWILLFEAYRYTTVSVATLCYYMEPAFVTLASALLLKEKLTAKSGICTVTALAGMLLVSGVTRGAAFSSGEYRGVLMGLGAAVLYSTVVLMNKKAAGVDAYEKCIIQLSAAAVIMIPYLLLTEDISAITFSPGSILCLLLLGIVHTGIAYALYFGSMDGLKAQTIAIFSYIDPVVALILSALLLAERMSMLQMGGAVLILGSAVLSELQKKSA